MKKIFNVVYMGLFLSCVWFSILIMLGENESALKFLFLCVISAGLLVGASKKV